MIIIINMYDGLINMWQHYYFNDNKRTILSLITIPLKLSMYECMGRRRPIFHYISVFFLNLYNK